MVGAKQILSFSSSRRLFNAPDLVLCHPFSPTTRPRAGTEVAAPGFVMTHKSNPAQRHFLQLFHFPVLPERLQKYIDLIRNDRFQPYFIVAFTLWLVGVVEMVQKTTGQRLDPRFWMVIAILITAYS